MSRACAPRGIDFNVACSRRNLGVPGVDEAHPQAAILRLLVRIGAIALAKTAAPSDAVVTTRAPDRRSDACCCAIRSLR
jgi:hypothetical protein